MNYRLCPAWRQWVCFSALVLFCLLVTSLPAVRAVLTAPLVVSEGSATGDAAYVLAAGAGLRERLEAAADLYQMGRVPLILLMREDRQSNYNFKAHASWTPTQWAIDFLEWRGIPRDSIQALEFHDRSALGTLSEARNVAELLSPRVKRLVLVTSPAHTRRALLAFRRSLHSQVMTLPYAATSIESSVEFYSPLWLEYLKFLIYSVVA